MTAAGPPLSPVEARESGWAAVPSRARVEQRLPVQPDRHAPLLPRALWRDCDAIPHTTKTGGSVAAARETWSRIVT